MASRVHGKWGEKRASAYLDEKEGFVLAGCVLLYFRVYADAAGPETTAKYQTIIYLAASASAEFFADIGLCPFEAVKVLSSRFCLLDRSWWFCSFLVKVYSRSRFLVSSRCCALVTGQGPDCARVCQWVVRRLAQVRSAGGCRRVSVAVPAVTSLEAAAVASVWLLAQAHGG
jgi:hypothetical protein